MIRKAHLDRDSRELSLLFDVARTLERAVELREALDPLFTKLHLDLGMSRGTLTLLNRQEQEVWIEAAHGHAGRGPECTRYALGEGITGRVVSSGSAVLVPSIVKDPDFLHRAWPRDANGTDDLGFVCVPVRSGSETLGALSCHREAATPAELQRDLRLLTILAALLAPAVRHHRTAMEKRDRILWQADTHPRFQPANIIGKSKAIQNAYDLIAQVSRSEATVLLEGESGVGKELVAHAIHQNSPRSARPFIRVSCAALPQAVLESELFGHEKGAFTGAVALRKGRFELAHGGTLFLDEIGDIAPSVQISLLRVLQEREFERVGGTTTLHVDVRIVVATHRDLPALIADGRFREDLYYRLNVFPIRVPPLRERRADIVLLADHFVEVYGKANGKAIRRISTPAIDMLMNYHWPGNVRELENCIERAVLLSDDEVIRGHHLPPSLQTAEATGTTHAGGLQESLDRMERELVIDALKTARGNMAKAARALGLTERTMGLRVRKYGISVRRFRTSA